MNRLTLSPSPVSRTLGFALVLLIFAQLSFATTTAKKRKHRLAAALPAVVHKALPASNRVPIRPAAVQVSRPAAAPIIAGGPWTEPTYADSTIGDNVDGEDLEIRRAAVEALGGYNGSVVVAN